MVSPAAISPTSRSRGYNTLLDEPRPVQGHHNGTWYRSDLTATRYELDTSWWGFARFIVGMGMMHWYWKHEDKRRRGPGRLTN